ncbi:hypothetical protein AJ79_05678 [Helicocarpus griseus UAMH5409]|uniref:Nucleolar protein 12 n=1 Tax=Helicocarpus griseus UAMH5409 TaxID=1447875 RepID=A0A2B7XLV3_9EURO|nr:hypothetical protein AJ79_05678 [Helicocarpus griseus UAMH5409]
MGKKQKTSKTEAVPVEGNASSAPVNNEPTAAPSLPFLGGGSATAIDPTLASLFESSAGPVKAPQFTTLPETTDAKTKGKKSGKESRREQDPNEPASSDEDKQAAEESDEEMQDAEDEVADVDGAVSAHEHGRKRKRGGAEELEESYMRRIAKEGAKEEEKRRSEKAKRRKVKEMDEEESGSSDSEKDEDGASEDSEDEDDVNSPPPVHESLTNDPDAALLDKSARTVFLSNVSNDAIKSKSAKKTLLKHLSSFLPSLPESATSHKIESIRFRSTAFSSTAVPKRAAYAKRELMDSTTRSTNAYVVYTTTTAARRAPQVLNGTVVLDRHLRVDSVAHPSPIDYKRCVFVGNLGFVDEETPADEEEAEKRKKKNKPPADVEEGLWRTFNEHTRSSIAKPPKPSKSSKEPSSTDDISNLDVGPVESVRVIRDPATRISKGIAYVQFYDENAVEAALLLDDQKFPPMLPRKLRVTRAKRVMKKASNNSSNTKNANKTALGARRGGDKLASFQGRATGLLGKGGAWKIQNSKSSKKDEGGAAGAGSKPFIFEGHRATAEKGPGFKVKTKSRGAKAKGGKPKTRSTRRAATFRAGGEKKGGKGK